MKLLFGQQTPPPLIGGCVATIGNFDGVHSGHQALITELRAQANLRGLPVVVVFFEPQARDFLQGALAPNRIYRLREKILALGACGVDYVYCIRFNHYTANMSAVDFATQVLFLRLNIKYLLIGQDFRFGRARRGDVALLQQIGIEFDCRIALLPTVNFREQRVSSTDIRTALTAGDLLLVKDLLARDYAFSARVVRGDGLARQWGFPTANLNLGRKKLPFTGVFCVRVKCAQSTWYNGVANLGYRPTVAGVNPRVEIHILDLNTSLYGERLEVVFLHKLRDEVKFPDVDALIAQIHTDVAHARAYFK